MKQLKTAICFSGELRTFKVAMPRIMEYFKGYNADVFCHTWSTSGDVEHTSTDLDELYNIIDSSEHNVISILKEDSINHSGPFGNMLYSIQRANRMKRNHELSNKFEYDLVIKSRYDMLMPPGCEFGSRQVEDRVLYYSLGNRGLVHTDVGKHGLSDIIFWGDSPTMDVACDTYRYYNWHAFPRYLELMSGNMLDPKDSMLSPGTLIYQRTQKRNIRMQQVQPLLGETLWRTSVENLNPDTDFEEIKRNY
jgi:hypothetical protein